ncbi:MAG: hypothetical protein ACFCVD_04310 [Nodosilinea sp.]
MQTLLEHYKQNHSEFQKELQSADNATRISQLVQDELRRLSDIDGEYIGSLTKPQARVALSMLEAFRLSFRILTEEQSQSINSVGHTTDTSQQSDDDTISSIDGVLGGLAGGALGGAVTGGLVGGAIGGALGAFGATVALKTIHFVKPSQESKRVKSSTDTPTNSTGVTLDKKELLTYLEQTFEVIDQTVAEYGRLSEPVESKARLEDHPEVLEFMQNLIGETLALETQLPLIFKSKVKELSSILRKYGIRTQTYQENAPDAVKELFDFEPSLDPDLQNYVMAKPALTKGDQILLRGSVIEPSFLNK